MLKTDWNVITGGYNYNQVKTIVMNATNERIKLKDFKSYFEAEAEKVPRKSQAQVKHFYKAFPVEENGEIIRVELWSMTMHYEKKKRIVTLTWDEQEKTYYPLFGWL